MLRRTLSPFVFTCLLAILPGITSHQADRIISERPYANTRQLVSRRILSEDEYKQIEDRVVVNQ
jgi:Helix-hairpin-helix motif